MNTKKRKSVIRTIFLLLLLCLLLPISNTSAKETDKNYIIDDADILTSDQEAELNSLAKKYSKERKIDILILTTIDTQGYNTMEYSDQFYNDFINDVPEYNKHCVILCIDMLQRKKSINIYQDAQKKIDTNRSQKIIDQITPDLKADRYYDAFKIYLKKVHYYSGYSLNVNPDSLFLQLWFQLLLAILIGAVAVGIMIYHSGGRITTNSRTYLDSENSRLTGSYDNYIRTTVTRVKKPDSDNDNSDNGSSSSSSGESGF